MEGHAEEGEAVGTGPGPPVLTPQNLIPTAVVQDPSCCSNCYRPVSLENFGKNYSDLLCSQVKSKVDGPRNRTPGKKKGRAVTVLEALDIVFSVKTGSCFSHVLLDELNYVLCLKCTLVLPQLYKLFTEFADYSQRPSFLRSVFVQNVAWRTAAGQPEWIPRNDRLSYCKAAEADSVADDSGRPPDLEPEYRNQFMENPEDSINQELDQSDGEPEIPDYTNSYGRSIKRPLPEEKVFRSGTKLGPKTRTRYPFKNRPEGQVYRADVGKGGKNYECPIRFQRLRQNTHVLRHLPNHQVKNHFCTFCKSGFGTKRALCKHVVSAHRGQVRTNTTPPATAKIESDRHSKVTTSPSSEGSGKVNTSPSAVINKKVPTTPQPAMAMPTRSSGARRNLRRSSKPCSYTNAEKLKTRRMELMDPEPPPKPPLSLRQAPKYKGQSNQGSHPARQKTVLMHSGPSSKSKPNRKQERKENRKDSVPGQKPPKTDPDSTPAPWSSRKYKCPECKAKFFRLDHVTRHLEVHSIRNFRCSVCRAGFRSVAKLLSHTSAAHNVNPILLVNQGHPVTTETNTAVPLANDLQEPEEHALELTDYQKFVEATILECDNFVVD